MKILIVVVTSGWLAFNSTLELAGDNRQNLATAWPINEEIVLEDYDCLIGVPYGYGHLIGKEVYFFEQSGGVHGPFLVTDVESVRHHPHMRDNHLAADIDCEHLVHRRGYIVYRGDDETIPTVQKKIPDISYSRKYPNPYRRLPNPELSLAPNRY